jgi:hypothetical protein
MKLILILLISSVSAFGELAPSVYQEKQRLAPEHLQLHILDVTTASVSAETRVRVLAIVTRVMRTASKIKNNDQLEIEYRITLHPKRWCGPGEIPLLKNQENTVAYLTKPEGKDFYIPAAGAMSFRNF